MKKSEHGPEAQREKDWKGLWKEGHVLAAAREPELLARVGFTQTWQGPTASSTMARQKQAAGIQDFKPSTETTLLCWCLKKLPKYNGKQLCVKEQRPLKYQIVF